MPSGGRTSTTLRLAFNLQRLPLFQVSLLSPILWVLYHYPREARTREVGMAGRGWILTAYALFSLAAPAALQAQAVAMPSEEEMTTLARLHIELNAARDEFNNAIAAIHEVQAQQDARDELANKRAEILAKYSSTELEYQQKIFSVSTDSEQRALFDEKIQEVLESPPPA